MKAELESSKGGQVFDLAVGETAVSNCGSAECKRVTLVAVHEPRCSVRGVIRRPVITVEVNGERADIPAALYNLPQLVNGVKIGCALTRDMSATIKRQTDCRAFDKDARIRCWRPDAPLWGSTPLVYPVKQRWFACMTQMPNERSYVDSGELPLNKPGGYIYYHDGMDIGGHDKAVPVVAAHGGKVISLGNQMAADYDENGWNLRYDRVIIRDDDGWYYLYSHLDMIAPALKAGDHVRAGDFIGVLGKEGSSGGWSHLHFGMRAIQPSGRYGEVDGYPFLVEAYLHEHPGALLACARPHCVAAVGEPVELDGSRSICDGGRIESFRWSLQDGEVVDNVRAIKTYAQEGMYSEMLPVTDSRSRTDVDFCVVQVLPANAEPGKRRLPCILPVIPRRTYFQEARLRSRYGRFSRRSLRRTEAARSIGILETGWNRPLIRKPPLPSAGIVSTTMPNVGTHTLNPAATLSVCAESGRTACRPRRRSGWMWPTRQAGEINQHEI